MNFWVFVVILCLIVLAGNGAFCAVDNDEKSNGLLRLKRSPEPRGGHGGFGGGFGGGRGFGGFGGGRGFGGFRGGGFGGFRGGGIGIFPVFPVWYARRPRPIYY